MAEIELNVGDNFVIENEVINNVQPTAAVHGTNQARPQPFIVGADGQHYMPVQQNVATQYADMELLKQQSLKLQAQYAAIKEMAREADKKSEVAKHKSPQIKRSVDFLLSAQFDIEDVKELLVQASESVGPEVYRSIELISAKVESLSSKVDEECMANKIASKAQFGWRTVKYFKADSLFKGDNAEALTKKFKTAEYQAGKATVRGRGRGRGGYGRFHPYSGGAGRGDYRPTAAAATRPFMPPTATVTSASMFTGKPCFECGLEGHFQRNCPTKKK